MSITLEETSAYVTDMAKAELLVRRVTRKLGLLLRSRIMLVYKHYGFARLQPSMTDVAYLSGIEPEVAELTEVLVYAYQLGYERVLLHFKEVPKEKQTIALGVRYDKSRGTYGAVNQSTTTYLKRIFKSKAIEIVKGLNAEANKVIRTVIVDGLKNGSTEKQVTAQLEIAFNKLGLTGQSRYTIAQIARTQTQLAFNAGKWNAEQIPEVADSLWGYTYQTVGDDRVRPEHELIDGVTLPKHYRFWEVNYPPNGYNCRCQAIALFESETIKRPPREYLGPDEDFSFNPGKVFSGIL